jgi:hypothetical protein
MKFLKRFKKYIQSEVLKGIVQPLKRGVIRGYQSMGLIFLYHSIKCLTFFKGPRPFKQQKTILSGLSTHLGASLHRSCGVCCKKNSIAVCPEFDFSSIPVEYKVNLYRYFLYFSRIFYQCTGGGGQHRLVLPERAWGWTENPPEQLNKKCAKI